MKKFIILKHPDRRVHILPTDDAKTIVKKMKKIRMIVKGFDVVKFIHSNR